MSAGLSWGRWLLRKNAYGIIHAIKAWLRSGCCAGYLLGENKTQKEMAKMKTADALARFMSVYHAIVPNEEYNLFEAATLQEFRHSEVLYRLLSYEANGKYPFLESFLRRLSIDMDNWDFSCKAIHISREEHIKGRPIDVLVVCKSGNSALIIENKCCNARDMDGQLHDYIDNVKSAYSVDDVTCLYLRRIDALENPTDASTIDDAHASLVTVSSYREQVVPWLKNDVLRNLRYSSGVMVSSLIAYIDLLESWSGTRARTIEEGIRILAAFKSSFDCNDVDAYAVCKREIADLEASNDVADVDAVAVLRTVKQLLWESNPLADSYDLAEELKWMLKNNPYQFGRTVMQSRLECGEMFDYSSIGRWHDVVAAERNVIAPDGRAMRVRIHLNCGMLGSVGSEVQEGIVYGGVCQAVKDLPAYVGMMDRLESCGFSRSGQPEDGVGFFFASGSRLSPSFKCDGTGRDVIWNVAKCFAHCAKRYSDTLVMFGYKPVAR